MKWEAKHFYHEPIDKGLIMQQLRDFLNKEKIEEFTVVQMEKDFLEIVYKVTKDDPLY
ncbi:MAG: hypothetical protein ACH349_07625 [Candidatus Rhabdochlamydia sp.]